jgi:hypothetical protein
VVVEKFGKIKWEERISNDEVLTRVGETRCLIRTIGERKKELDWACVEGGWTVEGCDGGKNIGKQTAR